MATQTKTVKVDFTADESGLTRGFTVVEEKATKTASVAESKMSGASSRIGGAFGKLDGLLGGFGIPFTGALTEIGDKIGDIESKGEGLGSKLSAVGAGVGVGLGIAAAGIAVESIHLADSFEKVHANLETAVTNSGHSLEEFDKVIGKQTDSFAKLGFNATEYEGALGALTTATNDPKKALSYMGVVADLAAKSHKSLEVSALAVGKALSGNMKPIKALGIDLPIAAGGSAKLAAAQTAAAKAASAYQLVQEKVNDGRLKGQAGTDAQIAAYAKLLEANKKVNDTASAGDQIIAALGQRLDGAASRQSETFAGRMKGLQAQLENVGIKIGLFLIPYVEKLADSFGNAVKWIEAHEADFRTAFEDISAVVQRVWTAIEPIYKALWEQLRNVFGFIDDLIHGNWSALWGDFLSILEGAFNLVIAPLIGLYNSFKGTFDSIWQSVVATVGSIIGFFTALPGDILNAVGDLASLLWNKGVDIISGALGGVWQRVADLWGWLGGLGGSVLSAVGDLGGTLWGAGSSLINGLWDGMKAAWNGLADLTTFDLPKFHVWGTDVDIGGGTVHLLPHLATGVRNFAGGLALVGEQGPELVNLPRGSDVLTASQTSRALGGGARTIVVPLYLNGREIARAVWAEDDDRTRRNGGRVRTA